MKEYEKTVMITGGCGFIGGNLVNYLLRNHPEWKIINVDSLTYAANPYYISAHLSSAWIDNYKLVEMDICSPDIDSLFEKEGITDVIPLLRKATLITALKIPPSLLRLMFLEHLIFSTPP